MNPTVSTIIDSILGSHIVQGREYMYFCPTCHHRSKNLSVNIVTGKWKCWICNVRGRSFYSLGKKFGATSHQLEQLAKASDYKPPRTFQETTEAVKELVLPPEYTSLWVERSDLIYRHARAYMTRRGVTLDDILRYQIGYCTEGDYKNRIIIPSFDATNTLNYFIARDFFDGPMKYKNPPVSKNVVIFENQINWEDDLIICEGAFDALAIRRNAIPLLGKTIPSALEQRLADHKVKEVTVMLDPDARKNAIQICEILLTKGIQTYLVDVPEGQDAGSLGFEECWKYISQRKPIDFQSIVTMKLSQ